MTHFRTIVIVPKKIFGLGDAAISNFIDDAMMPYAEECDADYKEFVLRHLKRNFEKDAKQIIKRVKDDPGLVKKYTKLLKEKNYAGIFNEWEGGEVNEDGDYGHYTNPNSFYDWYRVGGRWNGLITKQEKDSEDGFNFGDEYESIENNSVKCGVLLEAFQKREKELKKKKGDDWNEFLIIKVVVKGKVFDCDDVGWFGSSKPKMTRDEWKRIYTKLLTKYKDDYAVALDCHV